MRITTMDAIRQIQVHRDFYDQDSPTHDAFTLAIDALKEKAERENPSPLTIEELWQMDGIPVWIKDKHSSGYEFSEDAADYFEGRSPKEYGKTWIAYRHKPKEDTT